MKFDIKLILAGALFTIILIYVTAILFSDFIAKEALSQVKNDLNEALEECINSEQANNYISRVLKEAIYSNISGTPSFIINEGVIVGNRDILIFKNALDNPIGEPKKYFYSEDDVVFGDPNAKVWIIEFSSPLCPHCQKYHSEKFKEIYNEYVTTGKAFYIFKGLAIFNREEEKYLIKTIYCQYKLDKSKAINIIDKVFKR